MKSYYSLGQTQVIRVTGEQRHDFLNRMTTNDLRDPVPQSVIPTLLTTEKGRVVDLLWHLERGDESWLVPSPGMSETIFQQLDQFLFPMDRATLELDKLSHRLVLVVHEPGSPALSEWKSIPGGIAWPVEEWFSGGELMLVWGGELGATGIQQNQFLSDNDFHRLRLERGVPFTGSELNGQYHVQELGLLWAVNFSKGCYPGQEVVARIYNYEKNQRQSALVRWNKAITPKPPARLTSDDETAGVVTSIVRTENGFEGFGLLREKMVAEGCELHLNTADGLVPVTYKPFRRAKPKGLKTGA
ncbi:MAG: hypothetical protein K9N34_04890 [Candidatus Marinimicrobia bacterium]|nr:hypothetical protein [Candidatus Neomarinimicrobiota bacterium]MCF7840598.1 hypothetical protein [Candidatus Neomarinimicrobiota bacterium]